VSRARFLQEAEAEFLREVEYYAEVQPNGGALFRQAVEAATLRALNFPKAGLSYSRENTARLRPRLSVLHRLPRRTWWHSGLRRCTRVAPTRLLGVPCALTARWTATPYATRYALRMVRVIADVRRHQHRAAERSNIVLMRVTTGKVVEGKVVVEGPPLEEGAVVTVLARESEETFRLSPEEEAELLLAIGEADRGETVSLEEVLGKLPGPRP